MNALNFKCSYKKNGSQTIACLTQHADHTDYVSDVDQNVLDGVNLITKMREMVFNDKDSNNEHGNCAIENHEEEGAVGFATSTRPDPPDLNMQKGEEEEGAFEFSSTSRPDPCMEVVRKWIRRFEDFD